MKKSFFCVIYTNTVEAGISFEVPGHFDVVIGITGTTLPIHVKSFVQMMYRIRNCPRRIIAMSEPRYKNPFERQHNLF